MKKYIIALLLLAFTVPSWAEVSEREYSCVLIKDEPVFFKYMLESDNIIGVLAKLNFDVGKSIYVKALQTPLRNPSTTVETFSYRKKGGAIHFYKISLRERLFPAQVKDDYLNLTLAVMEPSPLQSEIRPREASGDKEYIVTGKCIIL